MKFALHLLNTLSEAGGAYTFETDIVQAWLQMPSSHQMCFSTTGKAAPSVPGASGVEHVSLHTPFVRRLSRRLVNESIRVCKTAGLTSSVPSPSVTSLLAARRLQSAGIRFVWYLSQWDTPVSDVPYAFTVWDLQHRLQPFFPEVSENTCWEVREKHFRRALLRASFVITGTKRGKHEIEHFYGIDSARIRVLPLPTPTFALEDGSDEDRSILRTLDLPRHYLFYPAQFWSHKNHLVLLHALRLLRQRLNEPIALVFVGFNHGNRTHVEAAAAQLGVRDCVRFPGFVSRPQMKALYRNAVALTFSSFFGPDNLPPLEAFALRCPVVAADVPGSEEQLGDAALRVPPSSEEAFAQAVMRLLREPLLKSDLIKRGKQRAIAFTASNYVRAMSETLDEFSAVSRCWP